MPRPLRILGICQYFYPDSCGGVETVAYETLRRLAERGHDVDLLGLRTRPTAPDVERMFGLTVYRYGDGAPGRRFAGRTRDALFGVRRVLADVLEAGEYDVVLPHHYFPYYAYARLRRSKVAPEVLTFHASFWRELKLEGAERSVGKPLESLVFGGLARRTETVCLRRADRIVALSEFSRQQLRSHYPFAESKVTKIAGGVDLTRFRPADDRAVVRSQLGLPEHRPILFTARRLVPRMGLDNLIAAVAEVRASFPKVLLVIAGRGRMEADLKQLVSRMGLKGSVSFVGFVDETDLVKYYQAADLFVLPSLAFEGFGMVTLEALACGTPALGTPIGATPELLEPLARQLVLGGTEPASIRRGIQAMLEWLSDESAADRLRGLCRAYVEEKYGWERAVDALERVVAGLLEAGVGFE